MPLTREILDAEVEAQEREDEIIRIANESKANKFSPNKMYTNEYDLRANATQISNEKNVEANELLQ